MTKTSTLTGEQREPHKRRNFWFMMAGFAVGGGITGGLSGAFTNGYAVNVSPVFVIGFIAFMAAAFIGMSIYFFRSVDKLELADNLWGGLFGLYFYFAAVPAWWVLEKTGVLGPPGEWTIYFATVAVTMGAYLIRKIINR